MDRNLAAEVSSQGLPKANRLYGSLAEQMEQSDSFVMKMKSLLAVRQSYGIASSRQIAVPHVQSPGLLIMVHELPDARGLQITALNFSSEAITETVILDDVDAGIVVDMLNEAVIGDLLQGGGVPIRLAPYEGQSLRVVSSLRPLI